MNFEPEILQPISTPNLRNEVEKRLCAAILTGVFQPGKRLVESDLAKQMGVSRPPIREALSALQQEGLVVNIPRRGNFVVNFSEKDIDEVYSLRTLLELEAMRRVIPIIKKSDIDHLQSIVDDLGNDILRQEDFGSIVALDLLFHEYIVYKANHSRLYKAWKSMSMQNRVLIGITSRTYNQAPLVPKDIHQEILDAIKMADVKTATKKIEDHFLDAQERAKDGSKKLSLLNSQEVAKIDQKTDDFTAKTSG